MRLSTALQSGPVVLFFYPKAMTPGCTKETCHFRDAEDAFRKAGATPMGISADPVGRQQEFSARYGFTFPLLSDTDKQVAKAFGVKRPGPLVNKRATFVIGTDRRILAEIRSEINMDAHADKALEVLRGA